MFRLQLYIFCSVLVFSVIKGQIPSYIIPCHLNADFPKCALKNAQYAVPFLLDGVKEFDVPSFKPLKIPLIEFISGSLRLNGTDVELRGIENVIITNVLFEKENNMLGLEFTDPKLELDFHVNIDGKIGSLAIEGSGPAKIKLYNSTYTYKYFYDTLKKNGKTYATYKKDDFLAKPTSASIKIDNLFNGNKLLGDNMNTFLNENWIEVMEELRPVISEVVGSIVRRILANLFKKISMEEFFLGY